MEQNGQHHAPVTLAPVKTIF